MGKQDKRPLGSGILVLCFGFIFILTGIYFLNSENKVDDISEENLLVFFSLVNGFLFIVWAIDRYKHKTSNSLRVGRETIMFVMTIVSAFVAIIALAK